MFVVVAVVVVAVVVAIVVAMAVVVLILVSCGDSSVCLWLHSPLPTGSNVFFPLPCPLHMLLFSPFSAS